MDYIDAVVVKPKPKEPTKQPVVYVDAPLYETPPPPPKVKKTPADSAIIHPYENPIIPKIITPRTSPSTVAAVDGDGTWHNPNIQSTQIVAPKFRDDFYIVDTKPSSGNDGTNGKNGVNDKENNKVYKIPEKQPEKHITETIYGGDIIDTEKEFQIELRDKTLKEEPSLYQPFGIQSDSTPHVWNPQNTVRPSTPDIYMADDHTGTPTLAARGAHSQTPIVNYWQGFLDKTSEHQNPPLDMGREPGETRWEALARIQIPDEETNIFGGQKNVQGGRNMFVFDDVLWEAGKSTVRQAGSAVANIGSSILGDSVGSMNWGGSSSSDGDKDGFWWKFHNQPTAGKLAADAAKAASDTGPKINTVVTGWKQEEDISF